MLILNAYSFLKKMCSDLLVDKTFLKMVLKTAVFWKFCKICRKLSWTEFTVKEVTVYRVATFLNEALRQI